MLPNPPKLDDRTFADLVDEARRRIPRYTDEWTDFNESDPGMTLVQLFAWFTETMLWQMNQVPDLNYLKFLELLNIRQQPPVPAEAHLTFAAQPGADTEPIPLGAAISADAPDGGDALIFETTETLELIRPALSDVRIFDSGTGTLTSVSNQAETAPYWPFGPRARPGSELYLGFGAEGEPAATPSRAFPPSMRFQVLLPASGTEPRRDFRRSDADSLPPPVRLAWEFKAADDARHWTPLDTFADTSAALTRDGYLTIEGPQQIAYAALTQGDTPKRYWLRCRLAEGVYAQEREPRITMLAPNTVRAVNLATVHGELVGTSTGMPNQKFALHRIPIQADSLRLEVRNPDGATSMWRRVDDFLAAGPDDEVYRLDAVSGEIRFGDETQGRIPADGASLVADSYRHGGGARGNVVAMAIDNPVSRLAGVARVANLRRSVGGRDMESLETMKQKAPFALRNKDRAVTEEDYARLTIEAGGVKAAKVVALHNPRVPDIEAPGAATVFIIPDMWFGTALKPVPAPQASPDLVAHVCRTLEQVRMITAEIYVAPAAYSTIRLEASVIAHPVFALGEVRQACIEAVNAYLIPPLRPAGVGAGAAPQQIVFGATLYPNTLIGVLDEVPGVISARLQAVYVNERQQERDVPVRLPSHGVTWGSPDHLIEVRPGEIP